VPPPRGRRACRPRHLHIDILATLHAALVGPEAMRRAENGLGDWCAPDILRAQGAILSAQGQADAAEDLVRAAALLGDLGA